MPIVYDKLFELLEKRGYSQTGWLRAHGIYPNTVNQLRKNESVTTDTIGKICGLLYCQPGDIMEYRPDKDDSVYYFLMGFHSDEW